MTQTPSRGALRRLLHTMRAAHQRSSEEWIRRMEASA